MRARVGGCLLPLGVLVAACQQGPTKEEIDAAKNTIDCDHGGERIVIRFDADEARLVMPGGARVTLYQVPVGSGQRFTNGPIDLRGRGLDYSLTLDRQTMKMTCKPYEIPKKE